MICILALSPENLWWWARWTDKVCRSLSPVYLMGAGVSWL